MTFNNETMPNGTETKEVLVDHLKKYIATNIEKVRLEFVERTAVIVAGLINQLVVGIVFLLFIVTVSIGLGIYLSTFFDNNFAGFFIVAGVYLLLGIIMLASGKKMIEEPSRDLLIKKILTKETI